MNDTEEQNAKDVYFHTRVFQEGHIQPFTLTHSYSDTQIGRQFEVKCLAQKHIHMWQEVAGIEPTTFRLLYHRAH